MPTRATPSARLDARLPVRAYTRDCQCAPRRATASARLARVTASARLHKLLTVPAYTRYCQ